MKERWSGLISAVSRPGSGGCNIEGEDESWDFGTGAGFYVDATQDPWKTNYRMYSYVTEEVGWIYVGYHSHAHDTQIYLQVAAVRWTLKLMIHGKNESCCSR